MFLFSRERRKVFSRRIKGFWQEFSANKIGLVGLAIVFGYVFLAIFSPWLTPYDPILSKNLADSFAMPEWVTVFPQYSNLPRTMDHPLYWSIDTITGDINLRDIKHGTSVFINYTGGRGTTAEVWLTTNFTYPYDPTERFYVEFHWSATKVENTSYALELNLIAANGSEYRIWSKAPTQKIGSEAVHRESSFVPLLSSLGLEAGVDNLAEIAFSQSGVYTLVFHISLRSTLEGATAEIRLKEGDFWIMGLVHGLLGTDHVGGDLFSQLIYGSQISLTLGLSAAILGTAIGILYGVISGYIGGTVDEIMMRIVDILLVLPVLPLLLALVMIYGVSVFWIIVLIAIFGWQGLSRVIRSQVLSVREMAFVECARASGASKFYIMIRHLIPNVFPIAFASLVLRVPGAILTEAVLSFLGFGDPGAPTWGRILNHAWGHGAFGRLAWWWIIPPGLAITIICLAFVFMGHAVDEVVNPKLRRRR